MPKPSNLPIEVAGVFVNPGERRRIEIPVAKLPTGTSLTLPIMVVNGAKPGPTVWISAAVHGDEVNGVEIIGRVLEKLAPRELAGCLITVPIVNVFGFNAQSRYLPDRRDLNRSFPGLERGSVAASTSTPARTTARTCRRFARICTTKKRGASPKPSAPR